MISKQQLGNTLWGMADSVYDKVEDYKTYILSLLFFKRLSDNWAREIESKVCEDRIVIYGSAVSNIQEFVNRIRATNAGVLVSPPAYGESMYEREVQARSLVDKITVEKK
jgi:type I restriction-modification system DNA methylase subunit